MTTDHEEGQVRRSVRDVAAQIRAAIQSGEYAVGSPLPSSEALGRAYGVHRNSAQKAVRLLAGEGWVRITHRQPTVVLGAPKPAISDRSRAVFRDHIGYFFDLSAQDWRAVAPPTSGTTEAPDLVAHYLGTSHALYRERLMGPPPGDVAHQISTSYIPVTILSDLPVLAAERTGPGGIYDRMEEHYGRPLEWDETVGARLADAREREALGLSRQSIVIVVTRRTWVTLDSGAELVLEVNESRMDASRWSVSYSLSRDETAAWPRSDRPA